MRGKPALFRTRLSQVKPVLGEQGDGRGAEPPRPSNWWLRIAIYAACAVAFLADLTHVDTLGTVLAR